MISNIFYLHSNVAKQIKDAISLREQNIEVSLSLNKSNQILKLDANSVVIDKDNSLSYNQLNDIANKEKRVFILKNGELERLEYRTDYYYKLVPTDHAPTIEINGIQMHRTKDYDPFLDAQQKVRSVVKKGDYVLDTCGGLGYTAIWSIKLGASKILSVEYDKYVIKLRSKNPWSIELDNKKIKTVFANVFQFISSLESNYFDSIIHDPPRFSLAGELYGKLFYAELFRVLKKNGRLYHYTGSPHSVRRGNKFQINTLKRLKDVRFKNISLETKILGIIAIK